MLPAFKSPEARRGTVAHNLDEKVDIFTLGDLLHALVGKPEAWRKPGLKAAELVSHTKNGFKHPSAAGALCHRGPAGTCQRWWELIRDCWAEDAKKRPTATEVSIMFLGKNHEDFRCTRLSLVPVFALDKGFSWASLNGLCSLCIFSLFMLRA